MLNFDLLSTFRPLSYSKPALKTIPMDFTIANRKQFISLVVYFFVVLVTATKPIECDNNLNNSKRGTPDELIPREDILNHAHASAEMALAHIKENWIPLFDDDATLEDPTGSHEFRGMIQYLIRYTNSISN